MGFFFRRSASFGPLRLNFSRSGIGASVGLKGFRLTTTARGATYITVGSNGFYYRETIASVNASSNPDQPSTPKIELNPQPTQIHTAPASELVESSCEELINRLNERAQMPNPAWVIYALAFVALFGAMKSMPDAKLVYTPVLPQGPGAYASLVSAYGYPDKITLKTELNVVRVRTIEYAAASLEVSFVQSNCTATLDTVRAIQRDQRLYPALARDALKKLLRCNPPMSDPWVPVLYSSTLTRDKHLNGTEVASRLSRIAQKRVTAPPTALGNQDHGGNFHERSGLRTPPATDQYWVVLNETLAELKNRSEQQIKQESAERMRARIQVGALSLLGIAFASLGVLVHKANQEKRRTEITYELPELEKQKYSLVQQSLRHLSKAQRLWRVDSKADVYDWKRNAGASSTIGLSSVKVSCFQPPRVITNVDVPCLIIGTERIFFFLPDLILYWNQGRFGGVAYRSLHVEHGTTRFIEEGHVPQDAPIVGSTWRFVNKNGGPDRRFNNNRQLPIVQYGTLAMKSPSGLNIYLQTSNPSSVLAFANCWSEYNTRSGAPTSGYRRTSNSGEPPRSPELDTYQILGVSPEACAEEIASAYREKARMYHPDKLAGMAPEFQALADEKMKAINAAYQQLRSRPHA